MTVNVIDTTTKKPRALEVNSSGQLLVSGAGGGGGLIVGGGSGHSAAASGNPLRCGGKVYVTLDASMVHGDASDIGISTNHQVLTKLGASAENDWQFAGAAAGIVNTTTAVTIRAAGAANERNYLTALDLTWDTLGAATEFVVRDGASGTVIYRTKLPTAAGSKAITFPTPLRGSAATLMEVATLTASVTGGVFVNAQGYRGF